MLVEPGCGVAQVAEVLKHPRRIERRIAAERPERAHRPTEPEQLWQLRRLRCAQASHALVALAERLDAGPWGGLLPDPHGHAQGHHDIQTARGWASELKVGQQLSPKGRQLAPQPERQAPDWTP